LTKVEAHKAIAIPRHPSPFLAIHGHQSLAGFLGAGVLATLICILIAGSLRTCGEARGGHVLPALSLWKVSSRGMKLKADIGLPG